MNTFVIAILLSILARRIWSLPVVGEGNRRTAVNRNSSETVSQRKCKKFSEIRDPEYATHISHNNENGPPICLIQYWNSYLGREAAPYEFPHLDDSTMLLRLLLLTFALYTASVQQAQGSDIDSLIGEIVSNPDDVKKHGCGYRHPDGIGLTSYGDDDSETKYGEFPWMVGLLSQESWNNTALNVYRCGGALIHPQVVITAAHCLNGKKKFKIRAGEWNTITKDELFPHQDRKVQEYVVHPQYYEEALHNDIAILFLDSPFNIGDNVDVVCLPKKDTIFDGERCFATGWGKNGKEGDYQVILNKIDLPVIDRDKCQMQLTKTSLGEYFELHKSFICAGGEEGKDTCKGDGGSPLVCPIPGEKERYQHAGIVAWGIRCGDPDVPGVYSDVSSFRDWIDDNMRDKNLDTSFYQF